MSVLPACMHVCMCSMCVPGSGRGQKRTSGSPGTVVMGSSEPPCEHWEPSPLQEHVLLTVEPSPHPQLMYFFSGPCNEIDFFSVLFY